MQPCQVCGGMAVDQNGYCTQCGTFRGQPTQPVSGTPYPPQAGGYQPYQAGPGPASGAPWPSQTSAAPYPFSGPPVSGTPGYPAQQQGRKPLTLILIAANHFGWRISYAAMATALATSPAAWPPMPSATASRRGPAYAESSIPSRRRPTSERTA